MSLNEYLVYRESNLSYAREFHHVVVSAREPRLAFLRAIEEYPLPGDACVVTVENLLTGEKHRYNIESLPKHDIKEVK